MKPVIKKYLKRCAITIAILVLLFSILNFTLPLPDKIQYSTIVESSDGTLLHAYLTRDDKWRMVTELNEISPMLRKAIIFKEDKYFYYHYGVNPIAIVRAVWNNTVHGKRTSGASTITMQVARMMEPKQRNYSNKLAEMFRAFQLEWKYSKDEILQLYINLIPYGGNIEGIKAASYIYFEKPPQKLSLAEVTALTVIPNKPTTLKPGKNNLALVNERNKWLFRFKESNLFSSEEIKDALNEPLEMKRNTLPREAPHFCLRMKNLFPNNPVIKTTLNRNTQLTIEKIVGNAVAKLKLMRINNAAVLVINNKTHAVEAYIGSGDFNDKTDGGQVDGVQAIRSPGSTLKPLLYATAFDKGLLTPKSRITDVHLNVAGYFPENYDQHYNGNVTVEYALINSLNIPACKTLDDVGIKPFIQKLKSAGFTSVAKQEGGLGLSLILGGCGATLEQLTNMYSGLANMGLEFPVNYLQLSDAKQQLPTRLISPQSAYMVSDILSQLHRPDLPYNFQNTTHLAKIAWKTGTSYGRRDAWSIGYNHEFTVGVWVGNFSGTGVPELNGAEMATPILFEIFNTIDYNSTNKWFDAPKGIDYRLVCSETGNVPDYFCDNKVMDMFIPMVSSNEKCIHERSVLVSVDEKISYCTACSPATGAKSKMYHYYPPELVSYFETQNINYEKIPGHNPLCERNFTDGAPVITSPVNNLEFYLDEKEDQQLMLTCNASMDANKIYWFVNGKLFSSVKPNEKVFIKPMIGKSKITCADDKGRSRSVAIDVKAL